MESDVFSSFSNVVDVESDQKNSVQKIELRRNRLKNIFSFKKYQKHFRMNRRRRSKNERTIDFKNKILQFFLYILTHLRREKLHSEIIEKIPFSSSSLLLY